MFNRKTKKVRALMQIWKSAEETWEINEQSWREKELQWLRREAESLGVSDGPPVDEDAPWRESEALWLSKESSWQSQIQAWLSMEPRAFSKYGSLQDLETMYEERQKHWALRETHWLQKQALFLGRKQAFDTQISEHESREVQLLTDNGDLTAHVEELRGRLVKKDLNLQKTEKQVRILQKKLENSVEEYAMKMKSEQEEKLTYVLHELKLKYVELKKQKLKCDEVIDEMTKKEKMALMIVEDWTENWKKTHQNLTPQLDTGEGNQNTQDLTKERRFSELEARIADLEICLKTEQETSAQKEMTWDKERQKLKRTIGYLENQIKTEREASVQKDRDHETERRKWKIVEEEWAKEREVWIIKKTRLENEREALQKAERGLAEEKQAWTAREAELCQETSDLRTRAEPGNSFRLEHEEYEVLLLESNERERRVNDRLQKWMKIGRDQEETISGLKREVEQCHKREEEWRNEGRLKSPRDLGLESVIAEPRGESGLGLKTKQEEHLTVLDSGEPKVAAEVEAKAEPEVRKRVVFKPEQKRKQKSFSGFWSIFKKQSRGWSPIYEPS